jgi:dynein intermediate chain
VYDVAEKVVSPREGEWAEMQKTVQGLVVRESGLGVGVVGAGGGVGEARYSVR